MKLKSRADALYMNSNFDWLKSRMTSRRKNPLSWYHWAFAIFAFFSVINFHFCVFVANRVFRTILKERLVISEIKESDCLKEIENLCDRYVQPI